MLRFSANLTLLFQEVDILRRFRKAAGAGFKGVEIKEDSPGFLQAWT
ncbi:MAG: hypothetical protein K9K64_04825 [Desulfohalobiaceae bacterium]|nr:hypothetical protein [Desulfohalobiaceae bacterium]MCF8104783.1 hypothetical protein [Desulfohalobiaceae bacterium]